MGTAAGIGMGANIIGGELQGWASVLDQQAMKHAYQNELAKQANYQNQAMQVFGPQVIASGTQAMQQGLGTAAANRQTAYGGIAGVPLGVGASPGSGYKSNVADAYTNMMGGLRAKNAAYSDFQVQQALQNMAAQRQLDQISNFAGAQARNVFPLQMYKAQHDKDWMTMLGQAISSIGGGAANYAQTLGGPPQTGGGYYPIMAGGQNPAMWSGYGGVGNLPPQGTGYNPYTDQSTLAPSFY